MDCNRRVKRDYCLFDHPGIDAVEVGYIICFNPEAAAAASAAIREFLEEHL